MMPMTFNKRQIPESSTHIYIYMNIFLGFRSSGVLIKLKSFFGLQTCEAHDLLRIYTLEVLGWVPFCVTIINPVLRVGDFRSSIIFLDFKRKTSKEKIRN